MEKASDKNGSIDITSIGGAAFDVFICAPHTISNDNIQFPLGGKVKAKCVSESCGGGATNTSVGFSRLGMNAQFCGVMADDEWGKRIQKNLEDEGVSIDAALIVEDEVSSFSVILVDEESGRRSIIYSPNVNAHICDPIFPKDSLKKSKWIFLNPLTDVSCVILDDVVDLISPSTPAGRSGQTNFCKFVWNPGGSQIRDGFDAKIIKDLLKHTNILFLNSEEALKFTRASSIEDALKTGVSAGAKIMCVTDGANGAYISDGEKTFNAEAIKDIKIVDTTGAGDAFAVGVTWAIYEDMSLSDALCAGMISSASVIQHIGTQAGLLTDTEIRNRLKDSSVSVSQL